MGDCDRVPALNIGNNDLGESRNHHGLSNDLDFTIRKDLHVEGNVDIVLKVAEVNVSLSCVHLNFFDMLCQTRGDK